MYAVNEAFPKLKKEIVNSKRIIKLPEIHDSEVHSELKLYFSL